MSRAHHLAAVRTPLQLFNAVEARERFHHLDLNTLVIVYRKQKDRLLMDGMLDGCWDQVIHFELTPLRRNLYPWFLSEFPRSVDTCTIGLPKHLSAHLVNTLCPRQVRIIDDGNEMIIMAKQLDAMIGRRSAWSLLGKREGLQFLAQVTFFTIHAIERWVPPERLVKNDYRIFRAAQGTLPVSNEVAFIGSPVYERDLVDGAQFVQAMQSLRQHYATRDLTYYPHRYEDVDRLASNLEQVGIPLAKPESILEYEFAKRGRLPCEIVSFRSSALETLRDLYDLKATILSWEMDAIRPERQEMYRTLYQSFHQQHLKVVPLASLLS